MHFPSLLRVAVATLAVLIAAPSWAQDDCRNVESAEAVLDKLASATRYHVETRVLVDDMSARARIWGQHPDKLRIALNAQNSPGPDNTVSVFDGQYQWIQSGRGAEASVLRIDLSRVASPERPFDTGYYIMGTGLMNGESFPSTLSILREVYELKAACSEGEIMLEGPINAEAFKAYGRRRNARGGIEERIDRFVKAFGYLRMRFDRETAMLDGYIMGSDAETVRLQVLFDTIEIDGTVADSRFQYRPPADVTPRDVTDAILHARGRD